MCRSLVRCPPHPWDSNTSGTGWAASAPSGRKSVQQIETGHVEPGSGTLAVQPWRTSGAALASGATARTAASTTVASTARMGKDFVTLWQHPPVARDELT